tara:strand:+ start:632 stop:1564 length:933 start_codon:yes stop_codon:yes gene_type:complete
MKFLNHNLKGIMFHEFHDDKIFMKSQGSINKDQFYKIIKKIGINNILSPQNFLDAIYSKLKKKYYCLTFDDGLKCQFKIAGEILNDLNISAFFFIISSTLTSKPNMLAVYKDFRCNSLPNLNLFYDEFFSLSKNVVSKNQLIKLNKINSSRISRIKKKFSFYSRKDIVFRIFRDEILFYNEYDLIMKKLMNKYNYNFDKKFKQLVLNKNDIKNLKKKNHEIGLHSHLHNHKMNNLSYKEQKKDYLKCKKKLTSVTNKKIFSMSHPSGNYNKNTIKILKEIDIKIGFRHNTLKKKYNEYEIPRINHVSLLD